jgi:hypothetical protein
MSGAQWRGPTPRSTQRLFDRACPPHRRARPPLSASCARSIRDPRIKCRPPVFNAVRNRPEML